MPDYHEHYELRAQLVDGLKRDLIGPTGDAVDVIRDLPATAYVAGVLHPQPTNDVQTDQDIERMSAATDVAGDDAEVGGFPEPTVDTSETRLPPTMGLTCAIDIAVTRTLLVRSQAALYRPAQEGTDQPMTEDAVAGLSRAQLFEPRDWVRVPVECEPIEIDTSDHKPGQVDLGNGLALWWHVRKPRAELTESAVTVTLINTAPAGTTVKDLAARFQCGFSVEATDGRPVFVERRVPALGNVSDEDLRSYELLYRHAKTFAVGHGCGASWNDDAGDLARRVETAAVPTAPVRVAAHRKIDSPVLSMSRCAAMPTDDLTSGLERFVLDYGRWLVGRESEVESLPSRLQSVASDHLDRGNQAAARMMAGVRLLEGDEEAMLAFKLMQEAMTSQRATSILRNAGSPGIATSDDDSASWRPFQLGFILLCLGGIADPESPDRAIADLLWFPTGGGKTEAYLGLIAFAVFLRRLRREGGGVTVLMRYTLRLLTVQQFARAALLICSCERIRRNRDDLGEADISIGLWVGQAGTPNTLDAAAKALRSGSSAGLGNPQQLEVCPWCGHPLQLEHHKVVGNRLIAACGQAACEFAAGLPVHVVDEAIYDERPTLLIATEDKFAAIAWRDECRALFNLGTTDAPPALIVQDELHLISGPLGTLAGLYESAIDLLCETEGPAPKVIASTATIRRADSQTRSLFGREMNQFPPPGIDARDSYFSLEALPKDGADRLYVGLLAPAASHATLMIRTYARLLQSVEASDHPDSIRDAYWTLVGYFNSLRVLGAALLQVHDDVIDRIGLVAGDAPVRGDGGLEVVEMTSRVASDKVKDLIRQLELALPGEARDVVLATNMISVGLDVDRLGLMAVMGQPQATSEYIQATSRVGRKWPGLVCVLFNGNKSRDRSHYENFAGYHAALYRHVESTSLTPFSPRARDRALHAVFVAVARLTIDQLRGNEAAAFVSAASDELDGVRDRILARAARTLPPAADGTDQAARNKAMLADVSQHLAVIRGRWEALAENTTSLVYRSADNSDALLTTATASDSDRAFATGYSMRDVDTETTFRV